MQIGIGKWKAANGEMVEITHHDPHNHTEFPWLGKVNGYSRSWADGGSHCKGRCSSSRRINGRCEFDIIGPWEEEKPLNLLELPVGTWLKLRNGEKRRLNGNDTRQVLVSLSDDGTGGLWHRPSGECYQEESQFDVVDIWEEPKRRTVWVRCDLLANHNDGWETYSFEAPLHSLEAKGRNVLSRRYIKVELVEGEFDPLPEDR